MVEYESEEQPLLDLEVAFPDPPADAAPPVEDDPLLGGGAEEEPVEEEPLPAAAAPAPPTQPQFTPRETGLYARFRTADQRRQEAEARLRAQEEQFRALSEQVGKLVKDVEARSAAERAAADLPADDDPLGQLTHRLRGVVADPLQEHLQRVESKLEAFEREREAERQRAQQAWIQDTYNRGMTELEQDVQSAPPAVATAIESWRQRSVANLVEQHGLLPEEAEAHVANTMFQQAITAAGRRQTLPQMWAEAWGIPWDGAPAQVQPMVQPQQTMQPPQTMVQSVARNRRAARIPTSPSGSGSPPAGSETNPLLALANAPQDVYDRGLVRLAKSRQISVDEAAELVSKAAAAAARRSVA